MTCSKVSDDILIPYASIIPSDFRHICFGVSKCKGKRKIREPETCFQFQPQITLINFNPNFVQNDLKILAVLLYNLSRPCPGQLIKSANTLPKFNIQLRKGKQCTNTKSMSLIFRLTTGEATIKHVPGLQLQVLPHTPLL